MLKKKNMVSMALALGMVASIGASALASGSAPERTITERKMTDGRTIVATYEPVTRSSANITFDHSYGVDFETVGSTSFRERVWGKTHHYIKQYGKPDQKVNGYTRARWERGSSTFGDSQRCWDDDDNRIDGRSEATSGWISENYFYIAHTYYGA